MKRIIMFICMFALLIPSSLIMAQEESVSNTINIHLQLGEDKITINDESLTIVKPFVVNGTTLVPLRVITEAFGAELTWISATQTVILEYGETLIELSIGTKDAYVNNEIQTLLVEPVLEMGTTMVPLRFISENFGAEVKYDNLTKEIFITGTLIDSIANLFNGDEGMTHVGDSHFGWSMKYPSGLALDYQSFQGDTVFFEDANGEYDISIFVEDSKNMTQADLLKEITSYTFGTLLDRQTVNEEGRIYAKVLSKDSGGAYTEIRGFLQGKKVYYVFLEVATEEDYKNQEKFKNYQDLLNSFVLSYDPTSKETKDITKVKAGFIDYSNEDYGLTLKIPVDWRESWSSDVSFTNYELEQSFELSMTSREKGDTLASWAQRDDEMMRALYAKEYLELGEIVQTEVSGVPAIVRIVSALFGDEWMQLYDVYFFIGDYKINVSIDYLRDDYSDFKETLQTIMQSISIDEAKLSESFGYIEDTTVYDLSKTKTIRSTDYKYAIKIPEYWSEYPENDDDGYLVYGVNGSRLSVAATKQISYLDALNTIDYMIEMSTKVSNEFKLISSTTETMNGLAVKKYVYSSVDQDKNSYETTTLVMHKNNITYILDKVIFDASRTTTVMKHMADALASFEIE